MAAAVGPAREVLRKVPAVVSEPYDPRPARESMRGVLALGLLALLGGVTALTYLLVYGQGDTAAASELLERLFPPIVALAGTALGFYFGGKSAT